MGISCHTHAPDGGKHSHDEQGNHIAEAPAEPAPEPLVYTMYSDKTELFVEFRPLIAGQESRFAAHFTALGDSFRAVSEGSVTLTLENSAGKQQITAESPEVPGIFRLRMTPEKPGAGYRLIFDIHTPGYTDRIVIEDVEVYPDEKTAIAASGESGGGDASDITYLKEQAWKVGFANAPAQMQPFSEVTRVSGQILTVPGDEIVLAAAVNGVVSFAGKNMVDGSKIQAGAAVFTVNSSEVTKSSLGTNLLQAEQDMKTAQTQLERAEILAKDKIISQKELLETRLRYEKARSALDNARVSSNFGQEKQYVRAPASGYLRNLQVSNGQYVQVGQHLATITRSRRLLLRADVSQKYFHVLSSFTNANFRTLEGKTCSTADLNGRVVSTGKSADPGSPFLPIFFEIDNREDLVPGSVVEVFLLSGATRSLVIPLTALIEEQGVFYAYVQTAGETFQKRELQTGANDGVNVQVLSGIRAGERVVTKGAYQIKLSTASGTMPAHGHEH